MLLFQFPLTFFQAEKEMYLFIAQFMTILVLIGMVYIIIWEMLRGRISLTVLLLLLMNFASGSRSKLIYIYISHRKYQIRPHSSAWFSAACAAAIENRNASFFCTNRINLLYLKWSSGRLVIIVKGFLKMANFFMLIKRKSLSSRNFWRTANSDLKNGKSATPPLYDSSKFLSSALDEAKLFVENFFKNSNLDDANIYIHAFPSRTNEELHNIFVG